MKQIVETKKTVQVVGLFLRKNPDFNDSKSGEVIESNEFMKNFEIVYKQQRFESDQSIYKTLDDAYGEGQDGGFGDVRSVSIGDVLVVYTFVNGECNIRYYMVDKVDFSEFNRQTGEFL